MGYIIVAFIGIGVPLTTLCFSSYKIAAVSVEQRMLIQKEKRVIDKDKEYSSNNYVKKEKKAAILKNLQKFISKFYLMQKKHVTRCY